ncbi:MAG: sulfatase [Verrucomicrobia bacterium]|nr:sulfatase [Verrucomicrobiota bacterium]
MKRARAFIKGVLGSARGRAELQPGRLHSPFSNASLRLKLRTWVITLIIACCCWVTTTRSVEARPPNFVFILIDDLGWTDLGCFGSTFYKTPNIDRLAEQGMKFTAAYAACPVCSPTRASILTGKYPARLHLTDWLPGRGDGPSQKLLRPDFLRQLPLAEVTLAEALKPAGYVSASIGKWHLGGKGFSPEDQGFDLNIAGNDAGSPASYFHPYRNANRSIRSLEDGMPGEYLTDRLTTEAEKFIERHKGKPFFLYLAHYAVHIPLAAKSELIARFQNAANPGQTHTNAVYAAMIQSVDESVGRVMEKLEELKLADNTVIFFMSDNGGLAVKEGPNTPSTSNAPLREGKGYLYEGGIRAPLIIRWPGVIQAGSICHTPVCSIDFFPTILEMAGVKFRQSVDGVSLVPLLKQIGDFKRDALYWHYPHYANQGGKPGGIIRQGDYKLIEFYEDGHLELYDLKQDIGEKHNLADRMPDKAMALEVKLDAWRRDVKAQMMNPNPNYDAGVKAGK